MNKQKTLFGLAISGGAMVGLEEGFRKKAYHCKLGYPTGGYGTKLGPKNSPLDFYTIEFTETAARCFLLEELARVWGALDEKFDWFGGLAQARQDVLVSMAYQMGLSGFLKFENTIAFIAKGELKEASVEMLDSKWARPAQTPERALRHSTVFADGHYDNVDYYKSVAELSATTQES